MIKNYLLTILALCILICTAQASEILTSITPVKKFSTCGENISEGDKVLFKVTEANKVLDKDEIIIGTILMYKPNSFFNEPAEIEIGNFKTEADKHIKGSVYIGGSTHKKYDEFLNRLYGNALVFVRGGEIIIKPKKDILNFFTED